MRLKESPALPNAPASLEPETTVSENILKERSSRVSL